MREIAKVLLSRLRTTFPIELKMKALRGVRLLDKQRYTWAVTDEDPQFGLSARYGLYLQSGFYRLSAVEGRYINRLQGSSLYYDLGRGFNENDRLDLKFRQDEERGFAAYFAINEPVYKLRFDPIEGGRITFSARGFLLERLDEADWSAARARPVHPRRRYEKGDGELRLLVNLFRLLPAHKGAGGAGRLALAFLRFLPEFANVRVVIADHNESLVSEFPEVEFVLASTETFSEFEEHLNWCDCYFDFLNGLRPSYIPRRVVVLACVLDLQHMRLPTLFSQNELEIRLREYGYAIGRANRLIAISDYESENLRYFYGKTNVSVVHLSGFAAEDFIEDHPRTILRPKPYHKTHLIYPAVPWGHKNHETLIQAVAALKKTGRSIRLVLTNTESSPVNREKLVRLCDRFGLGEEVELRGFLSEPELIDLMRKSSGVVFPSLYEGFGIPLVDAMKLGVPILASNIPAVREICGTGAEYFSNHRNALSLAEDIWRFWCADDKAEKVAARRDRACVFSSRRMAEEVVIAAREAVASQTCQTANASYLMAPQRSVLSLLMLIKSCDGVDPREILRSMEEMQRGLGEGVDLTVAVGSDVISDELALQSFAACDRLILFDAASADSQNSAVEEFARRYNNSEFQMIIDWGERRAFSINQVIAMLQSLQHSESAMYAVVDPSTKDVAVGNKFTELEVIERFEENRARGNIILGVMFRAGGRFQEVRNGTIQFLSAYCSEDDFIRVPAEKAI